MEMQNLQVTDLPTVSGSNKADAKGYAHKEVPTAVEIQAWIVSYLAEQLEVARDEVDVTIPFERYGLDSSAAVGMTGELEDWLGCEIDPTVMYDYPTIASLVQHLSANLN